MENWTLTWTRLVHLDQKSVNAVTDSLSGVYRLSYKSNDGNYYVFYVGKAENIKQRISEHLSSSEINGCITYRVKKFDCYFRYAIVVNEKVRAAAERQMFKQYEPSCNENEPEGPDDIKVNLD